MSEPTIALTKEEFRDMLRDFIYGGLGVDDYTEKVFPKTIQDIYKEEWSKLYSTACQLEISDTTINTAKRWAELEIERYKASLKQ